MLHFPPLKILAAFDMSEPAMQAYETARLWARKFGCAVEAVKADPLPPIEAGPVYYDYESVRRAEAARLRERLDPKTHVHIAQGDAETVILRTAKKTKAEMIMMGTHGRAGIGRLVLGSVAENVTRRSPVPVLTVRSAPGEISQIVAPVNFTRYSERGLAYAAEVADRMKLPLSVLHVADPKEKWYSPQWHLDELVARLSETSKAVRGARTRVLKGEAADGIVSEAGSKSLIVLVSHKKGLVEDAFRGTTVERVLRKARCPVLSVPTPADAEADLEAIPALRPRRFVS